MLVELADGKCRSCGGQLEITAADDVTMEVEYTECGDGYTVEPDAFNKLQQFGCGYVYLRLAGLPRDC